MARGVLGNFTCGLLTATWLVVTAAATADVGQGAQQHEGSYLGQWRGIITQDLGPSTRYFDMEMAVAPDAEDSTAFTISCHVMDGDYHAYMSGRGTLLANGDFFVQEDELVRADSIPGMAWCLKRLELRKSMEKGVLHLRGQWSGDTYFGACPPGNMDLIRNVTRT